jgi:hypothetical protein
LYLLLIGPFDVLYGIFEWLANPVLLAARAFSFAGKNKIALFLGIAATALMVAFLLRHTIVASEAPTYAKITGCAAGYWLWLSSAIVALLGAAGRNDETKAVEPISEPCFIRCRAAELWH